MSYINLKDIDIGISDCDLDSDIDLDEKLDKNGIVLYQVQPQPGKNSIMVVPAGIFSEQIDISLNNFNYEGYECVIVNTLHTKDQIFGDGVYSIMKVIISDKSTSLIQTKQIGNIVYNFKPHSDIKIEIDKELSGSFYITYHSANMNKHITLKKINQYKDKNSMLEELIEYLDISFLKNLV
mgnify:CR=1 FL=1